MVCSPFPNGWFIIVMPTLAYNIKSEWIPRIFLGPVQLPFRELPGPVPRDPLGRVQQRPGEACEDTGNSQYLHLPRYAEFQSAEG